MTGYTPTPVACNYCGQAVFPNTPNALLLPNYGEWMNVHYQCPTE